MSQNQNPYVVSESPSPSTPTVEYHSNFLALIWPSLVFSLLILASVFIASAKLGPRISVKAGAIVQNPNAIWWRGTLNQVNLVLTFLGAYFVTAFRLPRRDGHDRSVSRSILIAVALTISSLGIMLASLAFGGVTPVALITPVVLLSLLFKCCWREVHWRRFAVISLATSVVSFAGMELLETRMFGLAELIFPTLLAHCICFAWWFATPKSEFLQQQPAQTD
ncbi:MAG: hypothetical protein ACK58L_06785 [Planctomycetota bacterium]